MTTISDLTVAGMSCAACVRRVEHALTQVAGVESAEVNLARGTARIKSSTKITPATLIAALQQAGYDGSVEAPTAPRERFPWLPVMLAAPLLINMALMLAGSPVMLSGWEQAAIATPVLIFGGAVFHKRGLQALRHGAATMDLLVVLGADAAYGLSFWRLAHDAGSMDLYFESGALIIALVRLGRWLEAKARWQTASALTALLALRPDQARKLVGGQEIMIQAKDLRRGDLVSLRPGERAPGDLAIEQGEALFDLSLLTGESVPQRTQPGDAIPEGAINLDGDLRARVTATGDATRLARIVQMVTDAQGAKPPIQHVLDRISAVFVPLVMLLAVICAAAWLAHGASWERALVTAISVLVIACPCALGLAAPVAIMAGTGVAARNGILIRDPAALEQAAKIKQVAFDKTGTLTEGKPALTTIIGDEASTLRIATALSRGSEHPLSRAILARGDAAPACEGFRAIAGQGVTGQIDGVECALGNQALLNALAIDATAFAAQAKALADQGMSVSFATRAGRLVGVLGFADHVRPHAAAAVAALQRRHIKVVMLSGDHPAAAQAIGAALGIGHVLGGLSPEQKLQQLQAMKADGPLAMVGDGINDAPALAAADLAMAMGSGSDLAIETAGITLMRPDPLLVPAALDIAIRTNHVLYQGLAWAFLYNLIALPLAALGHLTPLVAGTAMACSSLSVVLNALRLTRWKAG